MCLLQAANTIIIAISSSCFTYGTIYIHIIFIVTIVSSPTMSPLLTIYRESSMKVASLLYHTRILHTISSTMTGMQLSSSVLQLQPTPFPGVHEEITSIDSPNTPPLPSPTSIAPSSTIVIGFPSHTEDTISAVTNTPTTSEFW